MDYLNPNALLTPLGQEQGMYAPSWDQSLWSDVTRKVQAEELLRNQNYLNEIERTKKTAELPKLTAEYDRDAKKAAMEGGQEYLEAQRAGNMGEFATKEIAGKLDRDLYPTKKEMGILEADLKKRQMEQMKQYQMLDQLEGNVMAITNMAANNPAMAQQNIAKLIKDTFAKSGQDINWLQEPYGSLLTQMRPEHVLSFINKQRERIETQAQMFERLMATLKGEYELSATAMRERGANTRSANTDKNTMEKERIAVLREKSDMAQTHLKELNDVIVDLNYYIGRIESKPEKTKDDQAKLENYKKQREAYSREYQDTKQEYQDTVNAMSKATGLPVSRQRQTPTTPAPESAIGSSSGWKMGPDGVMRKEK